MLTFSLDGSRTPAGELVATLAHLGALRDISIAEPAIEDVVARLYAGVAVATEGRPVNAEARLDPA